VDSCPGLGVRNFITAELPGGSYRLCEFRKAHLAAIASGVVAVKAYGVWVYSLREVRIMRVLTITNKRSPNSLGH